MPPVDPRGMDVIRWSAFLVQDYGEDALPVLMDPDRWREWAMRVIEAPSFAAPGAPDPRQFPDWRPWAERLVAITVS